jgi:alpha-glucuronidase
MEFTSAWLNYQVMLKENTSDVVVYCKAQGRIIENAIEELRHAFFSLYNRRVIHDEEVKKDTTASSIMLELSSNMLLGKEGYQLHSDHGKCIISSATETGLLYGIFSLLRNLQL